MGKSQSKEVVIAQAATTGSQGAIETNIQQLHIVTFVIVAVLILIASLYLWKRCNARAKKWIDKQISVRYPMQNLTSVTATVPVQPAQSPKPVIFTS